MQVLEAEGTTRELGEVRSASEVVLQRFSEAARDGERWTTSLRASRGFWVDVYERMLVSLDLPIDDGLPNRLWTTFSDMANYALFEDVRPALDRLHSAGAALGIISNFEAWLEALLERLEVRDYFPVRVISGIEGIEKPDLDLFRRALERAGVSPSDTAYVGDSPHFDVDPAVAVGIFPVLIDRRDRFADPEVGARITSLDQLGELIEV